MLLFKVNCFPCTVIDTLKIHNNFSPTENVILAENCN